ncbi:MAG: DUF979 domain-containing protein [Brevinema sp.]
MFQDISLEIIYTFSGTIAIFAGSYALFDKNHSARFGTGMFWILFGVMFVFGKYIPSYIVGIAIVIMGILSVSKKVQPIYLSDSSDEFKSEQSSKLGSKIWIPALSIGVIAMALSFIPILGGLVSVGIASFLSFIIALALTKESPTKGYTYDAPRLLHNMGAAVILPQLLGALGAIFSKANVGGIISVFMGTLIPIGDPLSGVILYCVSMVLFTMIMGNAFAAFAVITAGIGMPFLINIGGDPIVVGALGLTSGYCGTLMTPMAANFNIVPASIMEISDKNAIIKKQLPVSLILLVLHIILMYFLAF